jgi:hypothetical protein
MPKIVARSPCVAAGVKATSTRNERCVVPPLSGSFGWNVVPSAAPFSTNPRAGSSDSAPLRRVSDPPITSPVAAV